MNYGFAVIPIESLFDNGRWATIFLVLPFQWRGEIDAIGLILGDRTQSRFSIQTPGHGRRNDNIVLLTRV